MQAANPDRLASRKPITSLAGKTSFDRPEGLEFSTTYVSHKKHALSDEKEGSFRSEFDPQPRSKDQIYPISFK